MLRPTSVMFSPTCIRGRQLLPCKHSVFLAEVFDVQPTAYYILWLLGPSPSVSHGITLHVMRFYSIGNIYGGKLHFTMLA